MTSNYPADQATLEYAISLNGAGSAEFYENGVYRGEATYATNDRFELRIRSGVVEYVKNGNVVRTSSRVPVGPLHFAAYLQAPGGTMTVAP